MCDTPPRSPTMVGIDVETMVWSSAAMSMPASSAEKIRLIRRRVSTIGGAAGAGGACTGTPGVGAGRAGSAGGRQAGGPGEEGLDLVLLAVGVQAQNGVVLGGEVVEERPR